MPVKLEDVESMLSGPTIQPDPEPRGADESDQSAALEQKLAELEQKMKQPAPAPSGPSQESLLLRKLMMDADIQHVIALKNSGKPVVIDEYKPKVEEIKPPEDLTDTSKLVEYLDRKIAQTAEAAVQRQGGPLAEQLNQLTQFLQSQQVNQYQQEIKQVQSKHKDFDQFRDQMKAISARVGDGKLSVEQLYVMAKMEAGVPLTRETGTESEKPGGDTVRVSNKRRDPVGGGKRTATSILEAAFERVNSR